MPTFHYQSSFFFFSRKNRHDAALSRELTRALKSLHYYNDAIDVLLLALGDGDSSVVVVFVAVVFGKASRSGGDLSQSSSKDFECCAPVFFLLIFPPPTLL